MQISVNQWEYIVPRVSAFGSILSLGIYSEGMRIRILLIRFVMLLADALPDSRVYLREEGVRILPTVVNMRDIQSIHQRHKLAIHLSTTDDEDLLICAEHLHQFGYGVRHFRLVIREIALLGQHDIASIRQWTLRQREESLFTHHHGAATGLTFEVLKVVGQMTEQITCSADSIIFGYCYYER